MIEHFRGKGRGSIFTDTKILKQMLGLRNEGVGPSILARKYGVHHSTIIYHANRYGISSPINSNITLSGMDIQINNLKPKIVIKGTQAFIRYDDDGSRINEGKNYGEYLAEIEKRKWDRLLKIKKDESK